MTDLPGFSRLPFNILKDQEEGNNGSYGIYGSGLANPMELIGKNPCDFPDKKCLLANESGLSLNSPLTMLFDVAGFRPGSRVTFLSGKVTKAIDAPPGLMTGAGRKTPGGRPNSLRSNKGCRFMGASTQRA